MGILSYRGKNGVSLWEGPDREMEAPRSESFLYIVPQLNELGRTSWARHWFTRARQAVGNSSQRGT